MCAPLRSLTRVPFRPLTLTIFAVVVLSGCSTGNDSASAPSTSSGKAPTTSAQAPTPPPPSSEAPAVPNESPAASELTLTVNGQQTVLQPTDVYCSGTPDNIQHIIGKTNNQPPLVEAKGTQFAMAKLGQGKPHVAQQPSGISYGGGSVTFNAVSLGAAVLDGTMVCTSWED